MPMRMARGRINVFTRAGKRSRASLKHLAAFTCEGEYLGSRGNLQVLDCHVAADWEVRTLVMSDISMEQRLIISSAQ